MATAARDRHGAELTRGAIGLREVIFQSITHMAPAAAVAFSIPFGAGFAGGSLPLSVVLALVGCVFAASSIGQLAKRLPSAGSFYTYTSRGLHPAVGFLVAWGYAMVESLVAPLLYLILGITVAGTFNVEFGWSADLWWIWAILGALIVFVLGFVGIQISARTGTLLGLFEILVFGALAITLIVQAGGDNTGSVFGTGFTSSDFSGSSGVIAGGIYAVLAFIGFEASAPLAEETRDPKRNILKAVLYSAIGIGLFYVLTTYAAAVFFGPERMVNFQTAGGGDPWELMAHQAWSIGWILVFLAVINSAIANSNAGANATTRTWFAMGRIGLLPKAIARLHPRFRSPYIGVIVQLVIGLVLPLWLGFQYDPLTAFGLIATINVIIIVAIYILLNLSCLVLYLREHRESFNFFLHGVIPVLGMAVFIPTWLTASGIKVFSFVAPLAKPASYAAIVDAVWMGAGVLYLIYLYSRRPERVKDTGRIFIEEQQLPERKPKAG